MEPSKKRMRKQDKFVLLVTIFHAEGLDNNRINPSITIPNRNYGVAAWVYPGQEVKTYLVKGLPNPVWNHALSIPLDVTQNCGFLYLDIVRANSYSDPGTSNGIVVVGRARIPLPRELNVQQFGKYALVPPIGKDRNPAECIVVSMKIKKFSVNKY